MDVTEFRVKVTELVMRGRDEPITDEEFWDAVGDWSLEVLDALTQAKRRARRDGTF